MIVAAAILAFDGAALLGLGAWSGRMMLVLVGMVFLLGALLVLLSWRRYRRQLANLAATHRALSEEAREMQRVRGER